MVIRQGLAGWKEKELDASTREEKAYIRVFLDNVDREAQQIAIESAGPFGVRDGQDDVVQSRGLHASQNSFQVKFNEKLYRVSLSKKDIRICSDSDVSIKIDQRATIITVMIPSRPPL